MDKAEPTLPASLLQRLPQLKEMEGLLRCDICYELLKTSVITACSHNFCSACIRNSLTYQQTCPSCSNSISESDLRPNRSLDSIIEHFTAIRKGVLEVFEERDTHRKSCAEFDLFLKASQESRRKTKSNSKSSAKDSRTPVSQPPQTSHYFNDSVQPENSSSTAGNSNGPGVQCHSSRSLSKRKLSKSSEDTDDIVCLGTPNKLDNQPNGSGTPSHTPRKSSSRSLLSALDSVQDGVIPSPAKKLNVLDYFSPKKSVPVKPVASTSQQSAPAAPGGNASILMRPSNAVTSSSSCTKNTTTINSASASSAASSRTVQCPVCGVSVAELNINRHLDTCADAAPPKPAHTQAPQRKRNHLPKLVYHLLSDSKLRSELKKIGLSTNGSRETLIKRHKNYVVVYNSECDKLSPRPVRELLRQVERAELQQPAVLSRPPQSIFAYHSKSSPSVIEEGQLKIQKKYKNEFSALLADLKRRKKQEMPKKPPATASSHIQNTEGQNDTSVNALLNSQGSEMGESDGNATPHVEEENRIRDAIPARLKSKSSDEVSCTPRRSKLSVKRKISLDSTAEFNLEYSEEGTSDCNSPVLGSKNDRLVVASPESAKVSRTKNSSPKSKSIRVQHQKEELFADYDDDNFSFDEITAQENELMAEMSSCSGDDTVESVPLKYVQHNGRCDENLSNGTTPVVDRPVSPLEAIRKCKKLPLGGRSSSFVDAADEDLPIFEAQESPSKQLHVLVNGVQKTNLNTGKISSVNGSIHCQDAVPPKQNVMMPCDQNVQISGKTSEPENINFMSRKENNQLENSVCVSPDIFEGDANDFEDDGDASSNCSFSLLDDRPQQLKEVGISEYPLASFTVKELAGGYESDEIPASQRRLHEHETKTPASLAELSLVHCEVQQLSDADDALILASKSCDSAQVLGSSEELCVRRKPGRVGALCVDSADLVSQDAHSSLLGSVTCGRTQLSCSDSSNLDGAESNTDESTRQLRSTRQQQKGKQNGSPARRSCRRAPARSAALCHKVTLCRAEGRRIMGDSDDSSKICEAASLGSTGRKRKSSEMTSSSILPSKEHEESTQRRSTRRRK